MLFLAVDYDPDSELSALPAFSLRLATLIRFGWFLPSHNVTAGRRMGLREQLPRRGAGVEPRSRASGPGRGGGLGMGEVPRQLPQARPDHPQVRRQDRPACWAPDAIWGEHPHLNRAQEVVVEYICVQNRESYFGIYRKCEPTVTCF